jgi:hypothetical protein
MAVKFCTMMHEHPARYDDMMTVKLRSPKVMQAGANASDLDL